MKDQDDRDLTPKLSEIGLSNYAPYLMNRIMGRYPELSRESGTAADAGGTTASGVRRRRPRFSSGRSTRA